MRKYKVRVINTQVREVPVYQHSFQEGYGHIKTGKVLRTDKIERKTILFSGSVDAFSIWSAGHALPATAKVERGPIQDEE